MALSSPPTLKAVLLKILCVIWFAPIYVGAVIVLGQVTIWLTRKAGWWVLGQSFENTILYTSAVYYGVVLIYLALTKRVWIPQTFVRVSVQYLFKLNPSWGPKWLKKIPAYVLTAFPAFTYLFLIVVKGVSFVYARLGADLLGDDVMLQAALVATTMAISWVIGIFITHTLLKHCHFLKVHALHELEK